MANARLTPRIAFSEYARAQARLHHDQHLAFRTQGTPTFGPDECDRCKDAEVEYRSHQKPFAAGWFMRSAAMNAERDAAIDLLRRLVREYEYLDLSDTQMLRITISGIADAARPLLAAIDGAPAPAES